MKRKLASALLVMDEPVSGGMDSSGISAVEG
jgi:hypothetical protein